jgi:hypothetical protein
MIKRNKLFDCWVTQTVRLILNVGQVAVIPSLTGGLSAVNLLRVRHIQVVKTPKMTYLLVLIPFLFSSNCMASAYFDTLNLVLKTCKTKADLIQKCNAKLAVVNTKIHGAKLERYLDFGCTQSLYNIEFHEQVYSKDTNDEGIYLRNFAIYVTLNLEDSIVLGILRQFIHREDCDREAIFCSNTYQIDRYLNQHEVLYKTQKSRTEFTNQLTGLIDFGFACGWGGHKPPKAAEMVGFVHNRKYRELSNWLKGINPELQAYAIVGLMALRDSGIKIEPNDELIIYHLAERNSTINSCAGCAYGMSTTIEDVLKSIEWYKRYVFK